MTKERADKIRSNCRLVVLVLTIVLVIFKMGTFILAYSTMDKQAGFALGIVVISWLLISLITYTYVYKAKNFDCYTTDELETRESVYKEAMAFTGVVSGQSSLVVNSTNDLDTQHTGISYTTRNVTCVHIPIFKCIVGIFEELVYYPNISLCVVSTIVEILLVSIMWFFMTRWVIANRCVATGQWLNKNVWGQVILWLVLMIIGYWSLPWSLSML